MEPRFVGQDELTGILNSSTKPSIKGFGMEYKNSTKPYALITFQDTRIQENPAIMIVTGDDYVYDNCGRYAVVGEEWAKATHFAIHGNSEKLKAEVAKIYRKKINKLPMWSVDYKKRQMENNAKVTAEAKAKAESEASKLAIKKLSAQMRNQLESVPHEGVYQGKEAKIAVVSGEWCIYVKKGYLKLGTFASLESALSALTPQA